MKILKFEGPTMRDALARVKSELGDQAVVVSTRQLRRGLLGTAFEIAVAIDTDDDGPASPRRPTDAPPADVSRIIEPLRTELRSLRAMVRAAGGDARHATELRGELAALRKQVQDLSSAPDDLEPPMSRDGAPAAARSLPADHGGEAWTVPLPRLPAATPGPAPGVARRGCRPTLLGAELAVETAPGPNTAPSTGRCVALVGPTGVGKTTTIAKLAARAALIDGRRVGLITVDNYRIGGIDQIRTFAELIGVPLVAATTTDEILAAIGDLADRDLILVDTPGRSPRDAAAIEHLAGQLSVLGDVEVHLTVAASTPAAGLDDLYRRYRALRPGRLLYTKLDELDEAPDLARAPIRLGLPVTWVSVGQQVPEDLEEPTPARLAELSGLAAAPPGTRGGSRRIGPAPHHVAA